jgi:uncharacterized membrane protein YfcA
VVCVIGAASFLRALVGFGDALVAMPLLSLLIGLRVATPAVALIGLVLAVGVLAGEWRAVQRGTLARMLAGAVLGIPLGVLLLAQAPEALVRALLGLGLAGYALTRLAGLRPRRLAWPGWPVLTGVVAGSLGGAFNTSGPPVVAYLSTAHPRPDRFRATLQGYFLCSSVLVAAGHAAAGLWTREVGLVVAAALPATVAGLVGGGVVARRVAPERFERLLALTILALGVLLVLTSAEGPDTSG